MIFGRIDRNTDTQYRDRNLAQQQAQFVDQLALDKEKTRLAHEQFMKNFGMQEGQMKFQQGQQGFANKLTLNEAVAKGLFRPIATQQQQGVMPGNMFMQNPGAIPSVDNGDPTMGPGFEAEGMRLQPVSQFKQLLDQRAATHTQESKFANQAKADKINALIKVGVPPAVAVFQTEDPSTASHMFSSPLNMIAALKMIGSNNPGADGVAKTVAEYMVGYNAANANANETESEKAYRAAMAGQANAHAGLFRSQQANEADAQTGYIVMNKYAAEVGNSIPPTDARYVVAIRQKIENDPALTPGQKAAAIRQLNNESTIRTQLENPMMSIFNQANKNNQQQPVPQTTPTIADRVNAPRGSNQLTPGTEINHNDLTGNDNWQNRRVIPATPQPSTNNGSSRESGSGPTIVNTKPATVSGPQGALQYTQPNQAPMPELVNGMVPIKRSDGSIDGYVTREQWQEMNQPATGFSGMGFSNPLSGFSRMMLEYQQRNAAQRKQQYNPNNQGFGYRPPNY